VKPAWTRRAWTAAINPCSVAQLSHSFVAWGGSAEVGVAPADTEKASAPV